MKRKLLLVQISLLISYLSFSQGIGIGTNAPDPSAALDITATNKGLLLPRLSTNSINAINNPARGLLVYDLSTDQVKVNIGTPATPNFQPVGSGNNNNNAWSLNGNAGINSTNQFLGTTDNQPLRFRINNVQAGELHPATGNIFWGLRSGQSNTTGFSNVSIGTDALKLNTTISNLIAIGDSALFHNTGTDDGSHLGVGISNMAIGHQALFNNTIGQFNIAIGEQSLFKNTIGPDNIAIGYQALFSNIDGNSNTAIGLQSLFSNITGSHNTAIGFLSLENNVIASNNTALGWQSLRANTTGGGNTATGATALFSNTTGQRNTADGNGALTSNITGDDNTAVGGLALAKNTAGTENTAVGKSSLNLNTGGDNNTAIGSNALSATTGSSKNTVVGFNSAFIFNMGSNNTLIGAEADADQNGLNNATAIGAGAIVNASNKVRIGNASVTVIEGQVPFTTPSDGRFKFNIKEDVKGLDFIMQLRPVTYQFDVKRFDNRLLDNSKVPANDVVLASYNEATAIRRTGFIAQEVEKAASASGYNFSGIIKPKTAEEHYSLSYESFVVPLVKGMQEQQQMINELKRQNADLQKRILELEKNKSNIKE